MPTAPVATAPKLTLTDVNGRQHRIGAESGKPVVLSFFREASCPYCNYRIYELTHNVPELTQGAISMVAVFASTEDEIRRFLMHGKRPMAMVADPELSAFEAYGVGRETLLSKLKAFLRRAPQFLAGTKLVRKSNPRAKDSRIIPADILMNAQGDIVETYYGNDIGDHIPIDRLKAFARDQH